LVDEIAAHLVGTVLLHHRKEIAPLMDRWIENPDLWVRRTAIIAQLTHKDRTDHARLFRYSLAQAAEKDFFIRKAIGWALRQYAYTAPDRVRDFLMKNRTRLSPLTYREASRVLIKQGVMV
jgi:3-methyladenine DNA glycosylase AlkD